MKVIFSTAYLGPIEYYIEYIKCDNPILETNENYQKQSYRNRCSIMSANNILNLIIPVKKPKILNNRKIKKIRLEKRQNWQNLHWKSLQSAYRSSPYFEFYEDKFSPFYNKKYDYLIDVNNDFHKLICTLLKVKPFVKMSKEYSSNYNKDFRNKITPKLSQKKKLAQYIQVFSNQIGFQANLSVIDLLFNLGPDALDYLKKEGFN